MPPKTARGAGRGRSRGRGGRAAAAEAPSTSAAELRKDDHGSQSTSADTPMADTEPFPNKTPVNEQADDQNDPNSSPATQPTETPAPTPIRLPPAITSTSGTASGSPPKGNGPARPSKFKPRVARTSAKEREEREAREREKESARLGAIAYAARASLRGAWGRGRTGRGRGDAMGRGRMRPSTASGPFAELPPPRKNASSSGWAQTRGATGAGSLRENGGRSSGFSGVTGGKNEAFANGGSGATSTSARNLFLDEPQYPHEDDDAPRVDIENINIQSDSDSESDDVVITGTRSLNKDKGRTSNKGGLKPIRLDRKEHKERGTIVNTEPSIKADPENEDDADVMEIDEGRSSKAPKRELRNTRANDVKIKAEPGSMSYTQDSTSSSPPSEFRIPIDVRSDDPSTKSEATKAQPNWPGIERKAKPRHLSKKDKMPVMQTEEDRSEWARHLEDMDILRREIGGMAVNLQSQDKGKAVEGDVDMEGGTTREPVKEEMEDGRVYLFQFPPVLPKLYNQKTSSNPNYIMDDPDVEMMIPFDLTKDDRPEIKAEAIEIKQEEPDQDELRRQKERDKLVVEEGAIGNLVLRESGEVELVWGGTNMKVGRGVETSFFSAGAVVDGMEAWKKDEQGTEIPALNGRAKTMAMGEIMGKFVATLDFTRFR